MSHRAKEPDQARQTDSKIPKATMKSTTPIHAQEIDCERSQPHMAASRFTLPYNLLRSQSEVPLVSRPGRR